MNIKKIIALVAILFLILPAMAQNSQAPKNGFDLSFGTRWLEESTENRALGKEILVGYHRNIYQNQIRVSSSLAYTIDDTRSYNNLADSEIQQLTFKLGLQLDLIQFGSFAIVAAGGAKIDWSKYRDRNLYSPSHVPVDDRPHYFTNSNTGMYAGAGFRFKPSFSRFAVLAMPININYGFSDLTEYSANFGLQFQF